MAQRRVIVLAAVVGAVGAALAFGEDPVAALSHRIEQGAVQLRFESPYGYLPALLRELHVPVESQMSVFSKTSIQSLHIEPSNPRVLYFNDSVAVGWVKGGFIELAAQDPGNGIEYYILQQRPGEHLIAREDCVRCHESGNMQLRSVTSAAYGVPTNEAQVDSRTPFEKMWGGWFVTGAAVPQGHRGNTVVVDSERRPIQPLLDPKFSLTASSDIVALMVFAQQIRVMNLLAHPAEIILKNRVNELADALLFVDEAPFPGPTRGSSGFAEFFSEAGPRDHLGRSLHQFDLQKRLMRYPCSYMIYSGAFNALAPATKDAIYRRMWSILSGEENGNRYRILSRADREAVIGILRDTKTDLPTWFGDPKN